MRSDRIYDIAWTSTLTWDILYGDGVVISESRPGETTDYTYGLERISAISGNTRTEYVYDGRGSVAAEVSYNDAWYTFGGGLARKTVTSKSYTPFGEQIGEAVSGFGYNGEYYNAATGMIYLRTRFYEPEMNRFAQKDLLRGSIADGISLNRYLYCQSDPVNFADYNGRSLTSAWNKVKGAVVGAVTGAVAGAAVGAAVGGVVGGIVGAVVGGMAGGIAGAAASRSQPVQPVNNTPPATPANRNTAQNRTPTPTPSSTSTTPSSVPIPLPANTDSRTRQTNSGTLRERDISTSLASTPAVQSVTEESTACTTYDRDAAVLYANRYSGGILEGSHSKNSLKSCWTIAATIRFVAYYLSLRPRWRS